MKEQKILKNVEMFGNTTKQWLDINPGLAGVREAVLWGLHIDIIRSEFIYLDLNLD